jgi:hypothetical protein
MSPDVRFFCYICGSQFYHSKMETFGKSVLVIIGLLAVTMLRGATLMKLWEWFVLPQFDVLALNLPTAIGIGFIASFLTTKHDKSNKDDKPWDWDEMGKRITAVMVSCLYALAFGWMVSLFM